MTRFTDGQETGTSEIAFSAGLTHHVAVNGGQRVKYDRIFTNVGSAYSPTTGVFTCPQVSTSLDPSAR